jgi:hypothetical protein
MDRVKDADSAGVLGQADEAIDILRMSPLLDPAWYRQTYADLRDAPIDVARHYLEQGAREGRNPHPLFDTDYYLQQNPDVADSGINPLVHYIQYGAKEGRRPGPNFSPTLYMDKNPDVRLSGQSPTSFQRVRGSNR